MNLAHCGRAALVVLCLASGGLAESVPAPPAPPEPWTPVAIRGSDNKTEVDVWGRRQTFAAGGLPTSIISGGRELLAGPVRLTGRVDGGPIEWQKAGNFVLKHDPRSATISGWQSGEALIVNTTTQIEYDGLVRIDLVLLPQYKRTPKLEQLHLEVPLRRELASLFHYFPGRWGEAQNSGGLTDQGLTLPFKPFVWLGDEDAGLGWMAESDRVWQPQDPARAIEVTSQGDQTLLRIRLLDSTVRLPWTVRFALQATPVKPWPADFHERRIWHAPRLGVGSVLPVPKEWWPCHRAFPDKQPLPTLDRAARLGVKTIVFHEDWLPIQNYPAPVPADGFKALVDACHQRGMKVLVYYGYEISSLAPEWAELHDDVVFKNSKDQPIVGWYRPPEQRAFKVCYNSAWRERLAEGIEAAQRTCGYDGLYLDGTIEPWGCCNQRHGCGYRTADGTLRPTYPIFAVRKLMERFQSYFRPRGGMISAHQSTCCLTATLSLADSYWDGEQFVSGTSVQNPLARMPLPTFRAEFMGRNFGVPCEFLCYERPPQWTFDHALAVSMLHDVRVRPCGLEALERTAPIWEAMTHFDTARARWLPYWQKDPPATATPAAVKVSLYHRPAAEGAAARALLVVSNLAVDAPAEAKVTLDRKRLGLAAARARDALADKALPVADGALVVPLEPMRMRLIEVE